MKTLTTYQNLMYSKILELVMYNPVNNTILCQN